MANETKVDGQYGGLGIASVIADSGDVVFSASPAVITATFPAVGGIQPTVARGKIYLEVKALNVAAVLGAVDLSVSDGTNIEGLDGFSAPVAAVAGQGFNAVQEFFCALAKCTNVVSVIARVVTTANTNGTARLRVLAGP
jgi:hypothetical protein